MATHVVVAPTRTMLITIRVGTVGSSTALKTKLVLVEPNVQLLRSYAQPLVRACGSELVIVDAVACLTLEALQTASGIDVDLDTLEALTPLDLLERTGCKFILIRCTFPQAGPSVASPLPNALQHLLSSSKQLSALQSALQYPARKEATRYDWIIYNALVRRLGEHGLGVTPAQMVSMVPMLMAVARALQYLLPFDDAVTVVAPCGPFHFVARQAHNERSGNRAAGIRAPRTYGQRYAVVAGGDRAARRLSHAPAWRLSLVVKAAVVGW